MGCGMVCRPVEVSPGVTGGVVLFVLSRLVVGGAEALVRKDSIDPPALLCACMHADRRMSISHSHVLAACYWLLHSPGTYAFPYTLLLCSVRCAGRCAMMWCWRSRLPYPVLRYREGEGEMARERGERGTWTCGWGEGQTQHKRERRRETERVREREVKVRPGLANASRESGTP